MSKKKMDDEKLNQLLLRVNSRGIKKKDRPSLLAKLIEELNTISVQDVWYNDEDGAISSWLYVANDISNTEEISFIKELLFWRECYVKTDARVSCIKSTDGKLYNHCVKHFQLTSFPCLILSETAHFEKFELFSRQDLSLMRRIPLISLFNQIHGYLLSEQDFILIRQYINKILIDNELIKSSLKNLLSKGKLSELIKKLENMVSKVGREKEDIFIACSAQYNTLEREYGRNQISFDEYRKESAKLQSSFLYLIDEMED